MTRAAGKSFWRPVGYYMGMVIVTLGVLQIIPMLVSVLYGEWDVAIIFLLTGSLAVLAGCAPVALLHQDRPARIGWREGMVVTAGAWFVGMLFCALPYRFSGNYLSYLDACFDVMSGLTTTGLALVQDMDHLANGINMWRHMLTFVGGQGMVVLALTFLASSTGSAYKMYVGEGKDERLAPNATHTARYIWRISLIYLLLGTFVFWLAGLRLGLSWDRALLHGMWIFMSAWSTGGFAPMSQNILYYHSALYEIITMIFFIIGSFNFALHHAVLQGRKRELVKNVETLSMTITMTALTLLATIGFMQNRIYPDAMALFRKVFYQLISGHTTTGFMSIYARQFYADWGELALFAITVAMLIGGSACSTAGGFKGLRMAIIFKSFLKDLRQMSVPESRIILTKYHHIRDIVLEDQTARSAFLIVTAYIVTYAGTTLAGMLCGYPFSLASFEAASATGNVGLSIGLATPAMPSALKVIFIAAMWMARLEFMAVLALVATLVRKVGNR